MLNHFKSPALIVLCVAASALPAARAADALPAQAERVKSFLFGPRDHGGVEPDTEETTALAEKLSASLAKKPEATFTAAREAFRFALAFKEAGGADLEDADGLKLALKVADSPAPADEIRRIEQRYYDASYLPTNGGKRPSKKAAFAKAQEDGTITPLSIPKGKNTARSFARAMGLDANDAMTFDTAFSSATAEEKDPAARGKKFRIFVDAYTFAFRGNVLGGMELETGPAAQFAQEVLKSDQPEAVLERAKKTFDGKLDDLPANKRQASFKYAVRDALASLKLAPPAGASTPPAASDTNRPQVERREGAAQGIGPQ